MAQSLYVKCKLLVSSNFRPQIDETLKGFAGACNQILFVAKPEKCSNTAKLHHQADKPVREATGQHPGQSRLSADQEP